MVQVKNLCFDCSPWGPRKTLYWPPHSYMYDTYRPARMHCRVNPRREEDRAKRLCLELAHGLNLVQEGLQPIIVNLVFQT